MDLPLGTVTPVPDSGDGDGAQEQAERFAALFRALYLTFHRRDGPRSGLPGLPGPY